MKIYEANALGVPGKPLFLEIRLVIQLDNWSVIAMTYYDIDACCLFLGRWCPFSLMVETNIIANRGQWLLQHSISIFHGPTGCELWFAIIFVNSAMHLPLSHTIVLVRSGQCTKITVHTVRTGAHQQTPTTHFSAMHLRGWVWQPQAPRTGSSKPSRRQLGWQKGRCILPSFYPLSSGYVVLSDHLFANATATRQCHA